MPLTPLQKLKPLIARIHREYADKTGVVPWGHVFKTHPEWQKQLDFKRSPQRIYGAISAMRKAGQLGAAAPATLEAPGTGFAPVPLPERSAAAPPAPDEAPQVLERLLREYSDNGQTRFSAAWSEHPEWRRILGADSDRGMRDLYWKAKRVAQRLGLKPPTPKRPFKPKGLAPPAQNGQESPGYTDGLPHCPHCGGEIAAWNRAYNAARNKP